jgi:hypothetical protein
MRRRRRRPTNPTGAAAKEFGQELGEIAMHGFKKPSFQQLEPKTMSEKIAFITAELGLEEGLPVAKAVAAANEAMGIVSKGPMATQVARLMTEVRLDSTRVESSGISAEGGAAGRSGKDFESVKAPREQLADSIAESITREYLRPSALPLVDTNGGVRSGDVIITD